MHPVRRFKGFSRKGKVATVLTVALMFGASAAAAQAWLLNAGSIGVTTAGSVWSVTGVSQTHPLAPVTADAQNVNALVTNTTTSTQTITATNATAVFASDSNGVGGIGTTTGPGDVYNVAGTPGYVVGCLASNFSVVTGGIYGANGVAGTTLTGTALDDWIGEAPTAFPAGASGGLTINVLISDNAPLACSGISPQLILTIH